jgi:periplasmic divalent cation tolerance protein
MSDLRLVYMTMGSSEEAERIGNALVGERLAACVNLLPGMRSIYRWKGAVEAAEEVVLIAKTRAPLVAALVARVKQLHSYEVPCAISLPILDGNPDYLQWLAEETVQP